MRNGTGEDWISEVVVVPYKRNGIQDAIELIKAGQVNFENEAILAGYTMAFHHLRDLLRQLRDIG